MRNVNDTNNIFPPCFNKENDKINYMYVSMWSNDFELNIHEGRIKES